jgi:hypothetical protein
LVNNFKHIKTPSFTTSEEEKKRRGSDLLLKNREPSLIGPAMSLNNDEILRPYEIEYFSNNDGSPGSSPHVRGRSKANLNNSNQAIYLMTSINNKNGDALRKSGGSYLKDLRSSNNMDVRGS